MKSWYPLYPFSSVDMENITSIYFPQYIYIYILFSIYFFFLKYVNYENLSNHYVFFFLNIVLLSTNQAKQDLLSFSHFASIADSNADALGDHAWIVSENLQSSAFSLSA